MALLSLLLLCMLLLLLFMPLPMSSPISLLEHLLP
jgi:hypothetical protein